MTWKYKLATTIFATAVAGTAFAGQANAQILTGWVGPTSAHNGVVYLHTSSIDNGGVPKASSRIYTAFGSSAPADTIGAMARLFREGALCSATDYLYNPVAANQRVTSVARDCGSGWYNSNGFVAVNTPDGPSTYVTFPSDSLQYTAPAARSTQASALPDARATGSTSDGSTYGSAEGTDSVSSEPDLVAAIGDSGTFGYVKSADLTIDTADGLQGARQIPLYSLESTQQPVDTFTIE